MHGDLSHRHSAALLIVCRSCKAELVQVQIVLQQ